MCSSNRSTTVYLPDIPSFLVSINCDINVHSPFSFLISLISSFVLYKFFSIHSIEAYYLFFQLKFSLFQSSYIPNVSEIIFYTISISSFPIRIQLPLSVDSSVPFLRKISINWQVTFLYSTRSQQGITIESINH